MSRSSDSLTGNVDISFLFVSLVHSFTLLVRFLFRYVFNCDLITLTALYDTSVH
jgi:hypothetical protein